MVTLRSNSDETLQIEGVKLVRGERAEARLSALELADGSWVDLPLIVLRGAKPGPVFYLGAAFHGDEINGVDIVTRFAGEVDLRELRGTIFLVPAQNPLALRTRHRYAVGHVLNSPMDQMPGDAWMCFPGSADGNISYTIAHTLFTNLMQHADYVVDVHTPTTGGRYAPFAFLPPPKTGDVAKESEALANAFGADFILSTNEGVYVLDGSPHVVMAQRGAVALGLEVGEGGRVEREVTERGLRGLRNMFRKIGMLGSGDDVTGRRMVIASMTAVRARRAGLVTRLVELNEEVKEGQVVASISDLFGRQVEEVRAPHAGPVVRITTFPMISAGERLVQLGVPR